MKIWRVYVQSHGKWIFHSEHKSKKDATDQADMVRGRVVYGKDGLMSNV